MGNMHLVTGYQGYEHVTAADHGSLYAAIFGNGSYVLDRGNKLAATVITNNQIRIADGDIVLQGRHMRLNEGASVDLTIENGAQGYRRHDLIVARYTRNAATGIEEASIIVIKGTPATSDPTDPECIYGDILSDHAETADFPLYRIVLDGISVGTPVQLFDVAYLVTLGSDKKIPSAYLPSMNYIPTSQRGAANGVAPLNASKKVDSTYLPTIPTLSDSVISESTTTAASSYAVKKAYDYAKYNAGSLDTPTITQLSGSVTAVAQNPHFTHMGFIVVMTLGLEFQEDNATLSETSVTVTDIPATTSFSGNTPGIAVLYDGTPLSVRYYWGQQKLTLKHFGDKKGFYKDNPAQIILCYFSMDK